MRRLVVVAAAVLTLAGCSTASEQQAPAPAPAPGTTPLTGHAAALAANTPAICDQAERTAGQFGARFEQDRQLMSEAAASKDASRVAQASAKATQDVQNYVFALGDMSKLTTDPKVKAALAAASKQVGGLHGDVRRYDEATADKLTAALRTACGR
jgi:hypothetical protein